MTNVIHVQFRNPRPVQLDERTLALLQVDAALSTLEETIAHCAYWAERARGKERKRRFKECAELGRQIVVLERARLRLTGAELCVLKGGKA